MKKIFGKANGIHAAGVTFENRQGKLWNVHKNVKAGYTPITILRREPNNEKDANAIAVIVKCGNGRAAKIGYVPANKALWMAKLMDEGKIVRANGGALVMGGAPKTIGYQFNVAYELAGETVVETVAAN